MLRCFQQGVSQYSIPNYIRTDHGGENVDVNTTLIIHVLLQEVGCIMKE